MHTLRLSNFQPGSQDENYMRNPKSPFFCTTISFAKDYGVYDPWKILSVTHTESGAGHSLNIAYLDHIISDLSLHAPNNPPHFDNESDKKRAINDAQLLFRCMLFVDSSGITKAVCMNYFQM